MQNILGNLNDNEIVPISNDNAVHMIASTGLMTNILWYEIVVGNTERFGGPRAGFWACDHKD